MSVSLVSQDFILDCVERFYEPSLPLYFVEEHLTLLRNIVLHLLNAKQAEFVCTALMLKEPIMSEAKIVYISVPQIAMLVNAAVCREDTRAELVDQFDVFKTARQLCETLAQSESKQKRHLTIAEQTRCLQCARLVVAAQHFKEHHNMGSFDDHEGFQRPERLH